MRNKDLYHALLDPACYPERPRRVFARDTHISRLYFTPRFVYKLKKPVNFGFLDFTSLDRRRFFCDEEKRLNQQNAPDTYLGTVAIRSVGGRLRVEGENGTVIDYAVKMRRLPQAYMLDRLIRRNPSGLTHQIERLPPVITQLFNRSPVAEDLSGKELFRRLAYNCHENISQTEPFCNRLLARDAWRQVRDYTESSLAAHNLKERLLMRAQQGLVRECHGDLHCEHICLTDPVRIYDCIEFNRRFRINDLLSELAFLLMDLDYRNCNSFASMVLEGCRSQLHGLDDPEILRFFLIYRAWVRGKVAGLTAGDRLLDDKNRSASVAMAQRYFAQALGYLSKPFLAITCGLMGSGKTTLARALAQSCNGIWLRSDEIRKKLKGVALDHHDDSAYGQGIYTKSITQQTYAALLQETEKALTQGKTVVVDASFSDRQQRVRFAQIAQQRGIPFLIVSLETPYPTLLRRLQYRSSRKSDISDGRPELLSMQSSHFHHPKDDEIIEKIDSAREVDYNVQLVLSRILNDHGWQS